MARVRFGDPRIRFGSTGDTPPSYWRGRPKPIVPAVQRHLPIAKDLLFSFCPAGYVGRELVGPERAVGTLGNASDTWAGKGAWGRCLSTVGTTSGVSIPQTAMLKKIGTVFSMAFAVEILAWPLNTALMGIPYYTGTANTTAPYAALALYQNGTNNSLELAISDSAGNEFYCDTGAGTFIQDANPHIYVIRRNGATVSAAVDGVPLWSGTMSQVVGTTGSAATTVPYLANGTPLNLFNRGLQYTSAYQYGTQGKLHGFHLWNRYIADSEVRSLQSDFFRAVRPTSPLVYDFATPSVAPPPTFIQGQSTFAVTGTVASNKITFTAPTTAGSLLVLYVAAAGTGVTFSTPAGWTPLYTGALPDTSESIGVFYYPNAPSQVSVTHARSPNAQVTYWWGEYANLQTSPFDFYTGPTLDGVSATPSTSAYELLISFMSAAVVSVGAFPTMAPFTNRLSRVGANFSVQVSDYASQSTATQSFSNTPDSPYDGIMAVFKGLGSAAPTATVFPRGLFQSGIIAGGI